jgi:hypothetical protein
MTNEYIQSILNSVIKQEYPEINVDIYVSSERDLIYITSTNKMVYNIVFDLTDSDYGKYVREGIDKHIWDKIRSFIRDLIKMLGISDKVRFYFYCKKED